MTKSDNTPRTSYPESEIEETYPEWLNKVECTCAAGAIIKPATLPSATQDIN